MIKKILDKFGDLGVYEELKYIWITLLLIVGLLIGIAIGWILK